MRAAIVGLVMAALLAGQPAADNPYEPAATLANIEAADPPSLDLGDLRRRISPPPSVAAVPDLPSDQLWIHDVVNRVYEPVAVSLAYQSEHADWYVERGRNVGDLAAAAQYFESRTFPTVTRLVRLDWDPGRDGRPKIAIFTGRTPGVAGYMSLGDLQPRAVFPYSNERPIVYLAADGARAGSGAYNGTLAHEFEHLAHAQVNPSQQGWIDEGLAELVSRLVTESGQPPSLGTFRDQPDVQLNAWSDRPWEARAHYEASYLWGRYLLERGGGPDSLPDLVQSGGRGFQTVERYAAARGLGSSANVFRDWLVANILDVPDREGGRFGYRDLDPRVAVAGRLQAGGSAVEGSAHQFGADYYDLDLSAPADLVVNTSPSVPLLGASDTRGAFFWSVRGDNLDTRLTRRFDLSAVVGATLRFRVWYDLELDYDRCYVLASRDGLAWHPQPGRLTRDVGGAGLGLGPAYTGRGPAAPAWSEEQVDLTPFVGGGVWLRFECVTDQNFSGPGLAVDDVAIPEIGFADDAEADLGWQLEGFIRTADAVAEPALVAVAERYPDRVVVREVALDAAGGGRLALEPGRGSAERRVVIVAGRAPGTLQEMPYRLSLEPAGP